MQQMQEEIKEKATLALLDELESRCETLRNLGFIE